MQIEEWWHLITSELFGAFTLGLLGGAISANMSLKNTKCSSSNIFIGAFGWSIAILTGVFFALALKGVGHLNPAITIAMAIADGTGKWGFGNYSDFSYVGMFFIVLLIQFVAYILAQVLVDIIYWGQIKESLSSSNPEDAFSVLSIHASSPIRESKINVLPLLAEFVATAVFIFAALFLLITFRDHPLYTTSSLIRIFIFIIIIIAILMALGGITGPSVNPSRELAAIVVYLLIPSKNKQKINWKYIYVPICGPILGSIFASLIFRFAIK